jgi:MarR family transcriptional regulator, organic hydroperoxide resistance regulator
MTSITRQSGQSDLPIRNNDGEGMEDLTSLDPDYNMLLLIARVRRGLKKNQDWALKQFGLFPDHAAVLYILKNSGDYVTPALLSRLMLREPQTLSGILNRMERRGLVKRVSDLGRKNLVRIVLTKKGEEAYVKSLVARETMRDILSVLSEEEYRVLWQALKKIVEKSVSRLDERNHGFRFRRLSGQDLDA